MAPVGLIALCLLLLLAGGTFAQPRVLLRYELPERPQVAIPQSLPCERAALLQLAGLPADTSLTMAAEVEEGRWEPVPTAWPGKEGSESRLAWLAQPGRERYALIESAPPRVTTPLLVDETPEGVLVDAGERKLFFDRTKGGLPTRFELGKGFTLEQLFYDRLYQPGVGGFELVNDKQSELGYEADPAGQWALVTATACYSDGAGNLAPGEAQATYSWLFWAGSPFITVEAEMTQTGSEHWSELHFLQLHRMDSLLPKYLAGLPLEDLVFEDKEKTSAFSHFTLMHNDQWAIGLLPPTGQVRVHDGLGNYGRYIHGPWVSLDGPRKRFTATLYAGAVPSPDEAAVWAEALSVAQGRLVVPALEEAVTQARTALKQAEAELSNGASEARRQQLKVLTNIGKWRVRRLATLAMPLGKALQPSIAELGQMVTWYRSQAERLATSKTGEVIADSQCFPGIILLANSQSVFAVEEQEESLRLVGLYRPADDVDFASIEGCQRLFTITARDEEGNQTLFSANSAGKTECVPTEQGLKLTFSGFSARELPFGAEVVITAELEPGEETARWKLGVELSEPEQTLWFIRFPELDGLKASNAGPDSYVLVPEGWGRIMPKYAEWEAYEGRYPSHVCAVQLEAYVAGKAGPHLYVSDADGGARTKELFSRPGTDGTVDLSTLLYPDDMGRARSFQWPYETLIGPCPGDWYDAAKRYRAWALEQKWCSRGPLAATDDVPEWLKKTPIWRLYGSGPAIDQASLESEIALREVVGTPACLHWYTWHQIPFDNNYPEYFPVKEGFAEGVAQLQEGGYGVMPYINGRLWDVGSESWKAEGAEQYATKDETGKVYIENYGSGRDLAPMCPTQDFWGDKITGIVDRLTTEYNVNGVYIDQVGAAGPTICLDPSHGHPLGGGDWWVAGYRRWLATLRADLKGRAPEKFLTTESNAEPYIDCFDAYLMCNSTRSNLVPLFSTIYNDFILTFGRYFNDPHDRPVFATQWGQLFSFGSQLGWFSGAVANDDLKDMLVLVSSSAKCREAAWRWMAVGEKLRDPEFERLPAASVSAEWTIWGAKYPVEFANVMGSAWRSPEGTFGYAFINITSDEAQIRVPLPDGITTAQLWQADEWKPADIAGEASEVALPAYTACFIAFGE